MKKGIARSVKWLAVSVLVALLSFFIGYITTLHLTAHGVHPAGVVILFVFLVASFVCLVSTVNAVALLYRDRTLRIPVNVGITVLGAIYIAGLLVWIYATTL